MQAGILSLTPSQQSTFDRLKNAWLTRGVDLAKMSVRMSGLDLTIIVNDRWPTIKVGARGGIQILQLKSYPETAESPAFDAAVKADILYAKQIRRQALRIVRSLNLVKKPAASVSSIHVDEVVKHAA